MSKEAEILKACYARKKENSFMMNQKQLIDMNVTWRLFSS